MWNASMWRWSPRTRACRQAECAPLIKDAYGAAVAGALVTGRWSGAANDTFSITTDSLWKATDYSDSTTLRSGLSFTCNIGGVSKSGWSYDAAAEARFSLFD